MSRARPAAAHVLVAEDTSACVWQAIGLAAAAVMVIGATTILQVSRALRPGDVATVSDSAPVEAFEEEGFIVPDGLTEAESETADEVQSTGAVLRAGLTPEVRAFADGMYIGITVWEIPAEGRVLEDWTIAFANVAANPTLRRDVTACVGRPVLECFPELDNEAGRRYAELALLSLATRRTVHVGVTEFAQADGDRSTYYNALAYVDSSHVAVLYHVIDKVAAVHPSGSALGVDMPVDRAVDLQLQVLSTVADELDRRLEHVEGTDVGR